MFVGVLRGRERERSIVDRLLGAVRAGESGALVVRGEPGIGKTALLEYAAEQASGCRVAHASGVQSEMELAFAGLHQLCAPMLGGMDALPAPQRAALGTAFGLTAGVPPDRFFVGLAVLTLLSEVAAERPLVCIVDDCQWLDRTSAQVLAFVARRLGAESVALMFAAREPAPPELAGLPDLVLGGLPYGDARALLRTVIRAPLDERVRDRILAETRGNPLALLELPRGLTPAELAGGFGLLDLPALEGAMEQKFLEQIAALPPDTQRLLLIAAADPVGEPELVQRAAQRLDVGIEAAAPAVASGLLEVGAQLRFRHPLVRSAIYQSASAQERRLVHGALAAATDPEADPDRRAWHRARATTGTDEGIAEELERSADRAQARGGVAAAAAFLERASALTPDPARRVERALAAALAKLLAGAPDAALQLLALAEGSPLDDLQRARANMLRAQIAFMSSRGRETPPLLLEAARQLEPLDVTLARDTYLDALSAATFVGHLAAETGVVEVSRAALAAPPPAAHRAPDLLLDGLALAFTEGYEAAGPTLRRALRAFAHEPLDRGELRWMWLACRTALNVWDLDAVDVLSARYVQTARDAGALTEIPAALNSRLGFHMFAGELVTAASLADEAVAVANATGNPIPPFGALGVAAFLGDESEVGAVTTAHLEGVLQRGEGMGVSVAQYSRAVLYNGQGRYDDALAVTEEIAEHPEEVTFSSWFLPELIEAAVRSGKPEHATQALRRLTETSRAGGTEWGLGLDAQGRALLSEGDAAEQLYQEAIGRLRTTRARTAVARARLLYGEWLRRQRRRQKARGQLRTAFEMFSAMGMEAFAQRAGRELLATGETARRHVETSSQLTFQEAQVARLAGEGLTNSEIGARLFISPRTAEYHLHKVFAKLGISSRAQLARAPLGEPRPERAGRAESR